MAESFIKEFYKLVQTGMVLDYQDFEHLRAMVVADNSTLSKRYFISSFISGSKEDRDQLSGC